MDNILTSPCLPDTSKLHLKHHPDVQITHYETLERYWWGEGEVKFYLDGDEEYPTICGTGMEDYVGGSWSFAKENQEKMTEQTYSTPFLGYPYYSNHDDLTVHPYHNDDCPPISFQCL